jgi:hypothetical protein
VDLNIHLRHLKEEEQKLLDSPVIKKKVNIKKNLSQFSGLSSMMSEQEFLPQNNFNN